MIAIRSLGIGFIGFLLGVFVMTLLVQNAANVDRAVVISDTPAEAIPGVAPSRTAPRTKWSPWTRPDPMTADPSWS